VLAIVPLSLIGYVAFSQVRSDRQRGTVDRLTAAADLQETQLREWIHARTLSLTILTDDPTLTGGGDRGELALQNASKRLKTVLKNDVAFREIFLVVGNEESQTPDGGEQWLSATTGEIEPRPAWAVSPRHLTAPFFWLTPTSTPMFEFAAPARSTTGLPFGFIVGQALFTPTVTPSPTFELGRTGVVYLTDRERQSLALQGTLRVSPPVKEGVGQVSTQSVTRALSGQTGAAAYENAAGIPVIGAYRWLDDLQLALIAEQDQAEAFAASDELAAGLIGAALGVALLTAVIAAVVTRQITRPIVLLTEAALQMSSGDLTVRVQSQRRDEIGILAKVFNTMASELYDLYASLELKVTERTRELQEAKEQIQYHAWQLAISAEVGRITTSILELDMLLEQASRLIRDAFQLDHVGVYLLDRRGEIAVLQSNVGQAVPPHERQLRMGGTHPVSWAITRNTSHCITLPDDNDHLEICHKLVLPLTLGTKTIGALDLTTRDSDGFSESDRNVLQTLADQLIVAIENARTYSQEREAANEMREIDRLRGQFLMRMSHQLATYLNTVIGFSQLMLKGLDGPLTEAQAKDLATIRYSGQQLSKLLNDILELANLEVGTVEMQYGPVNLSGLIAELQTTLASTLVNPQLHLEMHVEPDLTMMADAERLRQVLTNLVITAVEMSREGVITLRVTQVKDPRQGAAGHLQKTDEQIHFVISVPAVWDNIEGNHGISLALSRRLVELHGGHLYVQQRQDTTLFEFTLPANEPAAETRDTL
jgi:signal transduction histidine kinase/HAMP domain-containing protein